MDGDTTLQNETGSHTNTDVLNTKINTNFMRTFTFKLYAVQITTGIFFWSLTSEHAGSHCFIMYVGIQSWVLTV